MEVKIEEGVPIPPLKGNERYPWRTMKPGDSFVGPKKVQIAANAWKRYHPGFDYTYRYEGTNGDIRIWVTAQPETYNGKRKER